MNGFGTIDTIIILIGFVACYVLGYKHCKNNIHQHYDVKLKKYWS